MKGAGPADLRVDPAIADSAVCALIPPASHALETRKTTAAETKLPQELTNLWRIIYFLQTDGPGIRDPSLLSSKLDRLFGSKTIFRVIAQKWAQGRKQSRQQQSKAAILRGQLVRIPSVSTSKLVVAGMPLLRNYGIR
jgi:hypothetical protein